ncbi:dimethyl sulfoxide reductase anchor subunit family protein [Falsiroseomonas stagni]|uniref:DMSO reductase anchor subunit n=1 Tax=Falsiroseomonas stagni DSM 19981 TaxID=1123062 RepID=A0A1I4DAK6_9PROT|nr:DmsC/YnfH family molybdoenzyme membrane anchor subunit [Falsiroseomonas stagni]SFK90532.1 DMSO reductase anchor subunit [Falsiroseomonas stagni DSM 19981]
MNPAPSIILFTTASGAGYGLLFWLGVLRPLRLLPASPSFALVALVLSLLLITIGLASSLLHLGRPERAWRALSQWRSSWLSREGVAAIATYIPAVIFGLALLTDRPGLATVASMAAAIGAAITVWCTGMIYASLKPIRQWHLPSVAPGYLLHAGFTGAMLLAVLGALAGRPVVPAMLSVLLAIGALSAKRAYWQMIDAPRPATAPTIESATGLGAIGRTRPLDPPHTEQNWLLREMAFRLGRKHRDRLRSLVMAGFVATIPLAILAMLAGGPIGAVVMVLAALVALAAMLAERWLMFAEATHTVTLYYNGES